MIAHLGLGSNLGDREAYLAAAVGALLEIGSDVVVSPLYETLPLGGPAGQGAYLNCVVRLTVEIGPHELLAATQAIEAQGGRVRSVPNAPRTLDVDILLAGELRISEPDLVIPHPRMYERAFVLAPLEDLDPQLVPPGWRESLGGEEAVAALVRRVGTLSSS